MRVLTGDKFERVVSIMYRLRAPGGCPWDREQTFDTIKKYTLEETYEVLEAIENRDWPELTLELGDLMLQVLFYAEMAREAGHFTIEDVLEALSSKLIGRHPHVFGSVKAEDSQQVLRNWEALKTEEKMQRGQTNGADTYLSGVSSKMPALIEAGKLSSKAAHVGFDWPDIAGLFEKLAEETAGTAGTSAADAGESVAAGATVGNSRRPAGETQRRSGRSLFCSG